ncbi:MAG: PAS domain S-box protein [Chlorobiaceae bacterium]|nr:PAS domain S-box protein [Chlorobiaceae bacterium]
MKQHQFHDTLTEHAISSFLEALPTSAVLIGAGGCIAAANSRFSRHFGLPPSVCPGMDLFELVAGIFSPGRLAFIRACCHGAASTGKSVSFEEPGKDKILKATINPVRSVEDDLPQLLVTLEDITEHKLLEQNAVDAKLRYDLALKMSRTGIWEIDLRSGKGLWSDTTWELFGLDGGKLEASTDLLIGIIHPDDRETVFQITESAKSRKTEIDLEYRVCLPDGSIRWCMVRGMPINDSTGYATRYLGIVSDITSRKLAEEAISESELLFRSMFKEHAAAMMIIDPDSGRIVDANRSAADFYGWPKERLRTMFIQEINTLPPGEVIQAMETTRSSRQCYYRFRHRHADGSLRDVDVFSSSIRIEQKELLYSIIHDVTNKIRIEQKLKESEELFRSMFADHCACMLVVDPETGGIVDANQAASDFYGWPINRLRMMNITDINCASAEFVRSDIRQWGTLTHRQVVASHRRADGSVRTVEIYAKKLDIKGRALIYDIIHDVTERKRLASLATIRVNLLEKVDKMDVEELLRVTLDEIEQVTDSSISFFFYVSKDQDRISLQGVSSNTLAVMSGVRARLDRYRLDKAGVWADCVRERKPVIHNDYSSLSHRKGLPEGHIDIIREMVVPVIRGDRVVAACGIGNRPFDYDMDDAGWINVVADMVWDILERKTAEEEYRKIEKRLQHSQKMELVGQLAAGIAHEINNPLNFIQLNFAAQQGCFADFLNLFNGYRDLAKQSDRLSDGSASELQRLQGIEEKIGFDELLSEMNDIVIESQRGIDRIRKIVEGMRSLSSRQDSASKVFSDINRVVHESLAMAKGEYRFCAEIEIRLEEIPSVPCVPDEINQVLLNLIVNSAHAIQSQFRSEKGRIGIKTWSESGKVHCSVADDGPGMPEEIRDRIFNPFFTTKSAGKGSGLGLSISYDIIVNKHQGEIFVECPPEGGSVFTFSLPVTCIQ